MQATLTTDDLGTPLDAWTVRHEATFGHDAWIFLHSAHWVVYVAVLPNNPLFGLNHDKLLYKSEVCADLFSSQQEGNLWFFGIWLSLSNDLERVYRQCENLAGVIEFNERARYNPERFKIIRKD